LGIPKRLIFLQLVNPSLATSDACVGVRVKLSRDFPWLLDAGWQVEYWGLRLDNVRSAAGNQLRSTGPRIPRIPLPRAAVAVMAWAGHFALALAQPRAGIMLAPTPYAGAGATLARMLNQRESPLIVRVMGTTSSKALFVRRSRLRFRILRAIEIFVLRRADLVIPMGRFTERLALRSGVQPSRMLDLPFPTSWRGARPSTPHGDRNPWRVVCAARLVPEKGVDILLRAWQGVVREVPDAELVIAGDGKARRALERLASDLAVEDSVRFAGWLSPEGMPHLLSGAAITVLPSRLPEGLGMALVEGGLSGCALVGTDLGGVRDIIEPEESGILVPPNDVVALKAALVRCLCDEALARRLGRGAQARAEQYLARREVQLERLRVQVESLRAGSRRTAISMG
jgi:glycosyltransferase involved in cell wall biosynthesis